MTSLVDVTTSTGNLSQLEKDLSEAIQVTISDSGSGSEQQQTETVDDTAIPDKLRGKSLTEVIGMYQNLESAHGRMANDLGQQRSLTDRLLELKRDTDLGRNGATQTPTVKKVDVSASELLEKPTEALERFSSAREAALLEQVNGRLNRVEQAVVAREFAAKHTDAQTVAQSPEFTEWVRQSPTRQRAARAAAQGDFGSADDLLTEFKTGRKASDKQEIDVQQQDNLKAARNASLESGNNGTHETGSKKAGKIYSRADLMRLRIEQPDKYYDEAYQAEIMKAYSEQRVK